MRDMELAKSSFDALQVFLYYSFASSITLNIRSCMCPSDNHVRPPSLLLDEAADDDMGGVSGGVLATAGWLEAAAGDFFFLGVSMLAM